MAILIVEEGGKRRRFRLNPGKLTLGSGEEATLRLTSEGVARIHAVLVCEDGVVTLQPEAGVAPIKVGGRSQSAPFRLSAGKTAQVGSARISIEAEQGAASTQGSKRQPARSGAAGRSNRASKGATRGRGRQSRDEDSAEERRPRRRKSKSGFPAWLVIVVGIGGALLVFKLLDNFAETSSVKVFEPLGSKGKIEEKLSGGDYKGVLAELKWVDENRAGMSAEWRTYFDGVQTQADAMQAEAQLYARNTKGTEIFTTQLEKFQGTYLRRNTRPEARVFLKRIAQFKADYPRHPQLGWCDRMAERYADIAKMTEPPTLADLEFEVKTLTWARPRDYKTSFELLNAFLASATGGEQAAVEALIQEKITEREVFFKDRMEQAVYYWDNKQTSKMVGELALLVSLIGDRVMADEAAEELVLVPGLDGYLRSYKKDRVSRFAALMENSIVRQYAENNDVF